MHRIVEVKPLDNYKVWLRFIDGTEGTVDLGDVAGKGVFSVWNDLSVFRSVFINPETHTIAWPGDIDLCPDSLHAELTGKAILTATHA